MEVIEWLLITFLVVETAETLLIDAVLTDHLRLRIPPLLRQIGIGAVYVGVALVMLSNMFGVDVTPLLATTSVASLVLGLALQQPLSNLFAGVVLHFDRAFSEGDWILVNDREGQIVHVGWRSTRVRTLSEDILILPNMTLLSAELQNFSVPNRVTARLVELPVPFEVSPEDVSAWVREELGTIQGILKDPVPRSWLVRFEPACQRYVIKMWVEDFRLHDDLESEALKRLWHRFRRENVPLVQVTAVRVTEIVR
jgi:small-conductance mechanosensitive channel